jgi:UDP-glucose 4-epimerase
MKNKDASRTCLVSGGAGFIGSYLTERLLDEGYRVTVVDNFSSGRKENLQDVLDNPCLEIVEMDLKKEDAQLSNIVQECNIIFHFAANPEVKIGETNPKVHLEENVTATFNLLEAIRKAKTPKTIVFASTSTVYGEASQIPTPENYAPLIPISTYGASKLACEAFIASYAHTFNHRALVLRFANVIGRKSDHGVIVDFIKKIKANPRQLGILGDGTQKKSYIHIEDCVNAIMRVTERFLKGNQTVDIYNIGTKNTITVKEIAKIVASAMNRPRIALRFTGGVDGGRGWKGDVKTMQLSIDKLLNTGWEPRYNSRQAVELATKELR